MRRWFDKKRQDNRGFTLVELVIVIAILAILVGLLAPQYTKYVESSRMTSDAENLNEMVKAFQVAVADLEGGVPAGTYTILINENGTTFHNPEGNDLPQEIEGEDGEDTQDEDEKTVSNEYSELCTSMEEALGKDWKKTVIKSDNWTSNNISQITAYITVGDDGSVSVEYIPGNLKQVTAKLNGEK